MKEINPEEILERFLTKSLWTGWLAGYALEQILYSFKNFKKHLKGGRKINFWNVSDMA